MKINCFQFISKHSTASKIALRSFAFILLPFTAWRFALFSVFFFFVMLYTLFFKPNKNNSSCACWRRWMKQLAKRHFSCHYVTASFSFFFRLCDLFVILFTMIIIIIIIIIKVIRAVSQNATFLPRLALSSCIKRRKLCVLHRSGNYYIFFFKKKEEK